MGGFLAKRASAGTPNQLCNPLQEMLCYERAPAGDFGCDDLRSVLLLASAAAFDGSTACLPQHSTEGLPSIQERLRSSGERNLGLIDLADPDPRRAG